MEDLVNLILESMSSTNLVYGKKNINFGIFENNLGKRWFLRCRDNGPKSYIGPWASSENVE